MKQTITQNEKDALVILSNIKGTTLNGKPANVSGRLNDFATVAEIKGPLAVAFSWQAVKRIMQRDGVFTV